MNDATTRVESIAVYCRVSSEDQAERGTIEAQRRFLTNYAELYDLHVAGEYVDDGVSGTVPLGERPEGRRLLQDAEAGRFGAVLVYRVDRLGRSLSTILAAHEALDGFGVAIKSGTEPLDTTNPIGRFIFQLLGSLAELDRSKLLENMSRGRDRVAAAGTYTGGPILLGYDVDAEGRYIPSERMVAQLGMTEADMVADIFERIADGDTTLNAETKRLTDLGVPRQARYRAKDGMGTGRVFHRTGRWSYKSLSDIIHNSAYHGEAVVKSRFGDVTRPMPPLVSRDTWDRAQAALIANRTLSKRPDANVYHLRGLVRCETCGSAYVGTTSYGRRKYRCRGHGRVGAVRAEPCRARLMDAEELETLVWAETRAFIENPGEALGHAQERHRQAMGKASGFEDRRRSVLTEIAEKETERERILTLFRKGTISVDEAQTQLDAIAHEAGALRESLETMRAQTALLEAQEHVLTESATMLMQLRDELTDIEATDDWAWKRRIIEQYVTGITIETVDTGKRRKSAVVHLRMRLEPANVLSVSGTESPTAGR